MTTDESTSAAPSEDSGSGRHPGMVRVKVRRRRRRRRRLIVVGVLLVVVLVLVALALMARTLVSAKHEAQAAQQDLTSAKAALSADHFGQARAYVKEARAHVDQARSDSGGLSGDVWSVIPVAGGAVDDERYLVDALDQTTSVAELGVQIYPIVSGRSAELMHGQRIDLKLLQDVADRTSAIGPHIDQALADLDQVKGSTPIVGTSVKNAKATALSYLAPLQETYRDNAPIISSLPALVGADGPRTYLLAMLNPAEQRYSGGGALSFTTLRFRDGVASFGASVNVDDILARGDQQVWAPVVGNTFHRQPALRVTSATFSPWWSVSGEELIRGYQKAFPGTRYDGVIGIDLQGLASLFRITGPIDLPSFGQITADNLVQTLGGSYGNFDSVEQRHRLNDELVPAFRQKLFEGGKMSEKVKSLAASAKGRHFVTYFRGPLIRHRFARVGLSGDLSPTFYDYIGVFSQNLNGSKTDYWQHRTVDSTVHLKDDGSARVHLHITVRNEAPPYTLPVPDPKAGYTTRYLLTRIGVFMPRNATFGDAEVNGKTYGAKLHLPTVTGVRNRKYVEGTMMLNSGQSSTMDVTYAVKNAAEVVSPSSLIYHLDVDPQDLVVPENLRVHVVWPTGFHAGGDLPDGWKATATGATYTGVVADKASWAIPLAKG
ncbi:MAG TPA: DUF4012 domain-containing protein [Nocardioides sp.]|uniref:DUF4012 domain-containing protein n=1 Tax=Nocardioides sp. TaxID=35761 RepID=UPI002F3EF3BD